MDVEPNMHTDDSPQGDPAHDAHPHTFFDDDELLLPPPEDSLIGGGLVDGATVNVTDVTLDVDPEGSAHATVVSEQPTTSRDPGAAGSSTDAHPHSFHPVMSPAPVPLRMSNPVGPQNSRSLPSFVVQVSRYGVLKFYAGGCRMVAECTWSGHISKDTKCHLSRTAKQSSNPARHGQGRPVGKLLAFLLDQHTWPCNDNHVYALFSRASRVEARAYLSTLAGPDVIGILSSERPKRSGEEDEPMEVPSCKPFICGITVGSA